MADKEIQVLDHGGVTVFDRKGNPLHRMPMSGAKQMLLLADGTLCILNASGRVDWY